MVSLDQTDVIVCTHEDGRTTVRSRVCEVVTSGMIYLTVTVGVIKTIDAVLDVKMRSTSPATTAYGEQMITIASNVVGFTLHNVAAGTTLCYEVVSIGY